MLLSLSCYCYCSPYSFVIVSGPLPQMLLLLLPSLSCYWSSLSVVLVIVPLPQLSAKEKELEKLRGDHAKIRAEIEEMMTGLNHEQVILIQSVTTWWYRNQYWKKFDIKQIGLENIR